MARPKKPKSELRFPIQIRLSKLEHATLALAAERQHMQLATWIRFISLGAAFNMASGLMPVPPAKPKGEAP